LAKKAEVLASTKSDDALEDIADLKAMFTNTRCNRKFTLVDKVTYFTSAVLSAVN